MFFHNKTNKPAANFQLKFFESEESKLSKASKCQAKLNLNLCRDSKFTHEEQTPIIVDDCA